MASDGLGRALPFVLRWEGGYVDNPADPGGATNKGVTQKVYDAWRRGQGLPAQDVRQLGDAEMHGIYSGNYWSPARCDELAQLLDLAQFDCAVNMGVGRAVRFLQAAVGCEVDGGFGDATLRAVRACNDPARTLVDYCDQRADYYGRLVAANPTLAVFQKGWMNRLNALRHEIGLPVREADIPLEPGEPAQRIPDIGVDPAYDL